MSISIKQFATEDSQYFGRMLFSNDGKFLMVSSSDDRFFDVINIWELATMEKIYRDVSLCVTHRVGMSADGRYIARYRHGLTTANHAGLVMHGGGYVADIMHAEPGEIDLQPVAGGKVMKRIKYKDAYEITSPEGELISLYPLESPQGSNTVRHARGAEERLFLYHPRLSLWVEVSPGDRRFSVVRIKGME